MIKKIARLLRLAFTYGAIIVNTIFVCVTFTLITLNGAVYIYEDYNIALLETVTAWVTLFFVLIFIGDRLKAEYKGRADGK